MLRSIGNWLKGWKFLARLVFVPLAVVFAIWSATGAVSVAFEGLRNYAAKANGSRVRQDLINELWRREVSAWQKATGRKPSGEIRQQFPDDLRERFIFAELTSARGAERGSRVPERAVMRAKADVKQALQI